MFYPVMKKYQLINNILEPDLLEKCNNEVPAFFRILFNAFVLRLNPKEDSCGEAIYEKAYTLLINELGICSFDKLFKGIYCTAFYAYIDNHKNADFLRVLSESDLVAIKRYFDIFLQAINLIDLLPAQQFIGFLAPLLVKGSHKQHRLCQKDDTEDSPILSLESIGATKSKTIDEIIKGHTIRYIGMTEGEWERYKEDIRTYCLEYYVYRKFEVRGSLGSSLEDYVYFHLSTMEYWKKQNGVPVGMTS